MRQLIILTFIVTVFQKVSAQSTTLSPGLLLPQMTTTQRTALNNPANGTLVFDTDTQSYWYRQTNEWLELPKVSYWQLAGAAGNEIKNTNAGGFWSANPIEVPSFADNTTNPPTAPVESGGTRLMWIPSRSAFRVGTVNSENPYIWNANKIGLFSFVAGYDSEASGNHSHVIGTSSSATGLGSIAIGFNAQSWGEMSFAAGSSVLASGNYSTAIGFYSRAYSVASTALGNFTQSSAFSSTAMGHSTLASGDYATSMGFTTIASGLGATASGYQTTASGQYAHSGGHLTNATGIASFAFGNETTASGDYSTALGNKVNTSNQKGAFMIGDSDPLNTGVTGIGTEDQLVTRFKNGYYLMTSGTNVRTGAQMWGGQSAWSAISDSTRKEKIVLADGESFLLKLRNLRLGSWNYKNQGDKPERFYGPMAQEIFTAFGKDQYGTIGNDTTVSTLNMDGLLFIFSQALEKRTQDLQTENAQLKNRLQAENQERIQSETRLQAENNQLKALIQRLDARLETLESKAQTLPQTPHAPDK
ncbi:tail fiber domain-containing protein [Emticicia agri]|uniref:Peptidase S74 domain-containing protein n=1 Tax=Emticicia agri TaxID=2492393 RepID=A0A4Q5LVR5_9BACT|nr:tail fiber domain-containing protein [Emticicia agri]RYU93607.1 hypothetical protein EWM59_20960 [Emticicia agri]